MLLKIIAKYAYPGDFGSIDVDGLRSMCVSLLRVAVGAGIWRANPTRLSGRGRSAPTRRATSRTTTTKAASAVDQAALHILLAPPDFTPRVIELKCLAWLGYRFIYMRFHTHSMGGGVERAGGVAQPTAFDEPSKKQVVLRQRLVSAQLLNDTPVPVVYLARALHAV